MDLFLDDFFIDFGASSGSISGTILESKWAKKRQHGPKNVLKSLTKIGPEIAKNGFKKWPHFWTRFSDFWAPFWVHFGSLLELKRPWCAKMDPRRTSRASKYRKAAIAKSVISLRGKHTFLVWGALKTSIRSSRRLSRGTWSASRLEKSGFQNWQFFPLFGQVLEPIWGPKTGPQIYIKSIKKVIRN